MLSSVLHIYGQQFWHNDVAIVGTRDALSKLWLALATALEKKNDTTVTSGVVFVADGEGYVVRVVVATPEQMDTLPMPYADEVAKERHQEKWHNLHKLVPAEAR